MELVRDIYEANCITHSGTMHTDDIFSTAFLDLYLGNIKVFRTTDIPLDINKDVIIYDIGRGKFDHHQEDALKRDNGITYCGFGLLWKEFGREFILWFGEKILPIIIKFKDRFSEIFENLQI